MSQELKNRVTCMEAYYVEGLPDLLNALEIIAFLCTV